MQYLLAANLLAIIAGDFNYNLLKVLENKSLDYFTDHHQTVNKPTHISGSLIGHVYIKKTLMEEFSTKVTATYFFVVGAVSRIISGWSVGKIIILNFRVGTSNNENIGHHVEETCATMSTQVTYEIYHVSLL